MVEFASLNVKYIISHPVKIAWNIAYGEMVQSFNMQAI